MMPFNRDVQECDAKDDDNSTVARIKIKTYNSYVTITS